MKNLTISTRASSFILLTVSLWVFYPLVKNMPWSSSSAFHTSMEFLSAILALSVGGFAFFNHRKRANNILLIITATFISTGILDSYHAIVTSAQFINRFPSNQGSLIPWSWFASRMLLSICFIIGWLLLKYEHHLLHDDKISGRVILLIIALFTLQYFLFFAMVPLPHAYYDELYFHRPEEFVPAAFFLFAGILYFKRGLWQHDILEYWIIIFLLINFTSEALYMPLSKTVFDLEFNIAHALKIVSYACIVIGLYCQQFTPSLNTKFPGTKMPHSKSPYRFFLPAKLAKHFGIEMKISLFVSAMVIISTMTVGLWTYYFFNTNFIKSELNQLSNPAKAASIKFESIITETDRDIHFLAGTPPIQGIIRTRNNHDIDPLDGSREIEWKNRLNTIFSNMLSTTPDYLEINYIAANNNGHSIVTVRKNLVTHQIETDKPENTHSYAHQNFFIQTINKPDDYLFLSNIEPYKTNDPLSTPHIPTITVAIPIYDGAGNNFGMIAIVQNLKYQFETLQKLAPTDINLSIINQTGQYLLPHSSKDSPNPNFKTALTLKQLFPKTNTLFSANNLTGTNIEVNPQEQKFAIAWHKFSYGPADFKTTLGFIAQTSYNTISTAHNESRNATLIVVFITLPTVLLFGLAFSKTITKPLRQMTRAVQSLTDNTANQAFPVRANDEVGILAREFEKMIAQVHERTLTLQHEIRDRKHAETKIQKQAQEANLLYQAISIVSDAESMDSILQWSINSICKITSWPIGHAYKRADPEDPEFFSTGIWNDNFDKKFEAFRTLTSKTTFKYGTELPGRIWESGKAAFIIDVNRDNNFQRAKLPNLPINSAFGFPIIVNKEIIIVLEFFHTEKVRLDKNLLHTVEIISSQIGHSLERREAENALKESEARHRTVVDSMVDGLITINASGIVESLNPAAIQIFGYDETEVVGKNINLLMPDSYNNNHENHLNRYIKTGEAHIIGSGQEVSGLRKGGTIFPMELSISEMNIGDHPILIGIVRDITERKNIEKMKNEFISVISHELRTPLTSIQGSLSLISKGVTGTLPDKTQNLVEIALKNSKHLILLINDILDMEAMASGNIKFNMQHQAIYPIVLSSVENNKAYGEQYGITFEINESADNAMVMIDANRLQQILSNLLSNAAKFSFPGGAVDIFITKEKSTVKISVSDYGDGIPEAFQNSIFEKFSQADGSSTRKKGGTGLGLSITKSMVEKMNGSIRFNSKIGSGTSFHVEFPISHHKKI